MWETEVGMAVKGDLTRAHGLDGSLENPDWPPLTLDEVDKLLQKYPQAGGAERLLSRSPRPFSAASVVATPNGKVFVKRHHQTIRDREGLVEEHRLIGHLAATMEDGTSRTQCPVQAVLANEDGQTAVSIGEWTYEVHPVAHGEDAYEHALSWTPFLCGGHARAAGRSLARLHQAAASYDAPARKAQQLVTSFTIFAGDKLEGIQGYGSPDDGPLERMQDYLQRRPLLRDYAEERDWRDSLDGLLMPLYNRLHPWLGSLKPLWTHNDFHSSNLTWSKSSDGRAEVAGIMDFGLADRTNAVHDLATAIERNIVEWLRISDPQADIVHLDHLDELLAGYQEILILSYGEARALVAMLPLVHCEFALSETDYFLSILHSREKAYLAYEGYFLGHAEWFRSEQGLKLLEHLEKWADQRASLNEGSR